MNIVRIVGSAVIALIALIVLFAGKPSIDGNAISEEAIAGVMSDDAVNQLLTDSAPQQAAANGWVARDLLEVIAHQNTDNRLEILATLGVFELCLLGATNRNVGSRDKATNAMGPIPPWQVSGPPGNFGGAHPMPQSPQA